MNGLNGSVWQVTCLVNRGNTLLSSFSRTWQMDSDSFFFLFISKVAEILKEQKVFYLLSIFTIHPTSQLSAFFFFFHFYIKFHQLL
jgi:hypothetical protein